MFELQKLPIEVRRQIFRLLLEPFGEQCSIVISKGDCKAHPSRKSNYQIIGNVFIRGRELYWQHSNIDYLFLEWLRKVSYVSKSFRKQLLEEFWEGASVRVGVRDFSYMWECSKNCWEELEHFIEDHPAAAARITELCIDFTACLDEGRTWPCVYEENISRCLRRFTLFSRHLRLKVLGLKFAVSEKTMEDLLAARGSFVTATAVRQIAVTKCFVVDVQVGPASENDEDLQARYNQQIEELMMPDTLRN